MKSMIKYQFYIYTQTHTLALCSERTSAATTCERKEQHFNSSFFHAVHQTCSTRYVISGFDIVIFALYTLVPVFQAILSFV